LAGLLAERNNGFGLKFCKRKISKASGNSDDHHAGCTQHIHVLRPSGSFAVQNGYPCRFVNRAKERSRRKATAINKKTRLSKDKRVFLFIWWS